MKQLLLVILAIVLLSGINKAQTVKAIPNGNFENWDSTAYSDLDSPWVTTNLTCIAATGSPNVTKVVGFSGQAVHLQTYIVNGDTLASEITNFGSLTSIGVPYSQTPTAINGYYRCNMVGHDTAWLVLEFLQAGVPVGIATVPFTGSVNGFTSFSSNITFFGTPDTMIVAAFSSNVIDDVGINAGSWLELDQLSFTGSGITQQIADGNFDSWTANSINVPVGWQTAPPSGAPDSGSGVSRSTSHYSGNYSIKLVSQSFGSEPQLTSGKFDQYGDALGGQPYQKTIDTLTGYYMYAPSGMDSGGILITLQNQGNIVVQAGGTLGAASTWTAFQMPINATSTPDTMRIDVYSSTTGSGGSILYLDNLQLKSQPLAGIPFSAKPSFGITAFPDPAQNQLNIRFAGNVPSQFGLKVYNTDGRLMMDNQFNSGASTVTLPIDQLSAGLYFYEITANGATVRNKFVKG